MRIAHPEPIPRRDYLLRQGVLKLLAVKDSDIRIPTLEQCRDAVDKGLHAGGAFSAVIPLTALYYGGFMDIDIAGPTRRGQDLFTLSKGHRWDLPGVRRHRTWTSGGMLHAIDARTGKLIDSFADRGRLDLKTGIDRAPVALGSRTPGRIFENLIILGSATVEGYLAPPGDIRAFDALTGKLVWVFHTIPRPGEYGYDSWPKDAYKYMGGVDVWGEFTVLAKRGIVYLHTASAKYELYGGDRPGDNLYADCLLALDARAGKRLWHFQTVHHDLWDTFSPWTKTPEN
jgi:PQQ enzyme repeat